MSPRTLRSLISRRDPGLVWENIARTAVVASLFVMPVMLLPWTTDAWELNKAAILLIGVFIGWVGFFGAAMARKKIVSHWSWFDWAVVSSVIIAAMSTIFSVDRWMSWTGVSGTLSGTFTLWLIGASLYFLTSRLATTPGTRRLWWFGLGGGLAASVWLQVFQLSGFSLLPSVFSDNNFISTISNGVVDGAMVAAVMGTVSILLASHASNRIVRLLGWAMAAASLIVLLFTAQPLGWAVFALGMITIVMMESGRGKKMQTKWIIVAVAIAAGGMLIQLSGITTRSGAFQPTDARLDSRTSNSITFTTFKHRPILGSGPSTWFHDFVEYRPLSFNQTQWWSNRFVRSRSAWSESLATTGALGLATLIVLFWFALRSAFRAWQSDPTPERVLSLFFIVTTMVIGFFSSWSLVWLIGTWVLMGLIRSDEHTSKPQAIGPSLPLGFALVMICSAFIAYFAVQVYTSDVLTQSAQNAILHEQTPDQVQAILDPAVHANPHNIAAASLLGTVLSAKANIELNANHDTTAAGTDVQAAVAAVDRAITENPKNPVAYEEANNVLNRVAGLTVDADIRARQYFTVLRQLEPTNPIHDVGYGQTALVTRARVLADPNATADSKKQIDQLAKAAIQAFDAALKKKPDYLQARFARAQAWIATEKYSDALADLEAIKPAATNMNSFWIQYGVTLSKLKRAPEAVTAFNQGIALLPTDPSGYLALADHYVANNDVEHAKSTLSAGLKAIPNNASITQKLSDLNK